MTTATVGFLTSKGGTSKTTAAFHTAVYAAGQGLRVGLVDLDGPDYPLRSIVQHRMTFSTGLQCVACKPRDLMTVCRNAVEYDLLIVDIAGADDPGLALDVRALDFAVIPARCSRLDCEKAQATMQMLSAVGVNAAYLMTQVIGDDQNRRVQGWQAQLCPAGRMFQTMLRHRVANAEALSRGRGVTEYASKSAAALEITQFHHELQNRILQLRKTSARRV